MFVHSASRDLSWTRGSQSAAKTFAVIGLQLPVSPLTAFFPLPIGEGGQNGIRG